MASQRVRSARWRSGAVAWVALFVATLAQANVVLAPIFQDGVVLQRGKPVPVWGTAAPGEAVRVRFGERTAATTADAAGRWRVTLAPLAASATPAELWVEGRNTLRVADVLVGEVWLCSGQSNMAFRLSRSHTAKVDLPAATFPLIRQFDVRTPNGAESQTPTLGKWSHTTPEDARYFTAVGYYFALELHRALGVPVGFIRAAVGGSRIEAWMGADALASDPAFVSVGENWQRTQVNFRKLQEDHAAALKAWEANPAAKKRPVAPKDITLTAPGALFEGMIRTVVPFALRGILWYQGESNHTRPADYRALFPAMIRGWRAAFDQGELPFYFVQLPNYEQPSDPTGKLWAQLREAQAAALAVPGTGMAVTIDVGDAKDLHPPNKGDVGRRLALLARAQVYGEKIVAESPRAIAFERAPGALRVRLSAAEGLHRRDGKSAGAEVAGGDRIFHPATLTIDGDAVVARAAAVPEPVAVRYAWANAPEVSLFNGAGLPVAPFRSDNW